MVCRASSKAVWMADILAVLGVVSLAPSVALAQRLTQQDVDKTLAERRTEFIERRSTADRAAYWKTLDGKWDDGKYVCQVIAAVVPTDGGDATGQYLTATLTVYRDAGDGIVKTTRTRANGEKGWDATRRPVSELLEEFGDEAQAAAPRTRPRERRPVKRPARADIALLPAQLPLVLQKVDVTRLLPAKRVVKPDALPADIGLLTRENPAALKRPSADAFHVLDLSSQPSTMTWQGQTFEVSDKIIARPPDLQVAPPVLMSIDQVERLARGLYHVNFSYRIYKPAQVTLPVRFHLNLQGPARMHVSWLPWLHQSGTDGVYHGRVVALMHGTDKPLVKASTSVGINAADADIDPVGSASIPYNAAWWKRYEDITRDNIKNYLQSPGMARDGIDVSTPLARATSAVRPTGPTVASGLRRALDVLVDDLKLVMVKPFEPLKPVTRTIVQLQSVFRDEPALLLFKTSEDNYAKALVRAERDSATDPGHLAVENACLYARSGAAFTATPGAGHDPSVANEVYATHWQGGGYVFSTWGFDLDWQGVNTPADDRDLWLERTSTKSRLRCQHGAQLAY